MMTFLSFSLAFLLVETKPVMCHKYPPPPTPADVKGGKVRIRAKDIRFCSNSVSVSLKLPEQYKTLAEKIVTWENGSIPEKATVSYALNQWWATDSDLLFVVASTKPTIELEWLVEESGKSTIPADPKAGLSVCWEKTQEFALERNFEGKNKTCCFGCTKNWFSLTQASFEVKLCTACRNLSKRVEKMIDKGDMSFLKEEVQEIRQEKVLLCGKDIKFSSEFVSVDMRNKDIYDAQRIVVKKWESTMGKDTPPEAVVYFFGGTWRAVSNELLFIVCTTMPTTQLQWKIATEAPSETQCEGLSIKWEGEEGFAVERDETGALKTTCYDCSQDWFSLSQFSREIPLCRNCIDMYKAAVTKLENDGDFLFVECSDEFEIVDA